MYIEKGYVNCTQMEGSRKWGKGEVTKKPHILIASQC